MAQLCNLGRAILAQVAWCETDTRTAAFFRVASLHSQWVTWVVCGTDVGYNLGVPKVQRNGTASFSWARAGPLNVG